MVQTRLDLLPSILAHSGFSCLRGPSSPLSPAALLSDPALAVKFFPTEAALFVIMTSRRFRIYAQGPPKGAPLPSVSA